MGEREHDSPVPRGRDTTSGILSKGGSPARQWEAALRRVAQFLPWVPALA